MLSRDYLSSEDAWYLHAGIDISGVADGYVVAWSSSLHKFIVKEIVIPDGGGAPAEHSHTEYLLKTGGSITGTVTVPDPVNAPDVANKSYVDISVQTLHHDAILGLGDDDHPQYILVDASRDFTSTPKVNGNNIWHEGNDGPGSGLNADMVDGQHASAFAISGHTHSGLSTDDHDHDTRYVNEVDHTKAVHDALSINAATLDGIDSASFVRSDATDTVSGAITFTNTVTLTNGSEGLTFLGDSNYFGSNLDARIIRMVDQNGASGNVDGGLVVEAYTVPDSTSVELLVVRNNVFTWKGDTILHAGNHNSSGNPHSQYTTQSASDARYLRSDTNTTYNAGTLTLANGTVLDGGLAIMRAGMPTDDNHVANKAYVDSVVQGLDFKNSVRAVSTSSVTLSGTQTVDGVALNDGERVLITGQSNQAQNGIWVVRASAWERPEDFDDDDSVTEGAFVFVEDGTQYNNTGWVLGELVGSFGSHTEMTWSQFSGAGESVDAGAGLTKSGGVIDVGQGTGIVVGVDTVSLDTTYTDGRYILSTDFAESVSDQVGTMVSGNTETGITVTYQDADNTLDFAVAYGTPVTQTPDQSNSAGSGSTAARANHIHNIPAAIASGLSNTSLNAEGTAASFARSDHTHAISGFSEPGHSHTQSDISDFDGGHPHENEAVISDGVEDKWSIKVELDDTLTFNYIGTPI